MLLLSLWLLIQLPPVQNWLVAKVTDKLSGDLHTRVSIRQVDFSLFNRMVLRGVALQDQKKDTLLYAGKVSVRITDWFFVQDKITLKYVGLDEADIRLRRSDSVWNYQFLVDYFGGGTPGKKKAIELDLKALEFEHVHLLKQDGWRGEDMELNLGGFSLDAQSIDFARRTADVRSILISEPDFAIRNYKGNRPFVPVDTATIRNDPAHLRWNAGNWSMQLAYVKIESGSFRDDKITDTTLARTFDGHHIHFSGVDADFRNVSFLQDTIRAKLTLAAKERSGFVVRKMTADIKFFPEAMEFAQLDLATGKSRLRKFFAMRFRTFDDMDQFETKVRMEADFEDASVDSDDIAYFAPALRDWKKNISITGRIRGTVSDLESRNIRVNAGRNTVLNGDFHLVGLPDIEKTTIYFRSNDLRTTYRDMVTLVPGLREIKSPSLDQIESLRFVGEFTGTIRDFTTSGTIQTNLGTVVSNVSMKLPANAVSVYSGTLLTTDFDLGRFVADSTVGKISFRGRVAGTGLTNKTVNCALDGTISRLGYRGYDYQNIQVNGSVAKNRFNGKLIAADSNLAATMNGLLDFSGEKPVFNFEARVDKANLKALRLTPDSVGFNGKLRFNFTGDDIDRFMGTARVYEASIYKGSKRLSFDSLVLESKIIDSSKTIVVTSNEFDAVLVGDFSIKQLPAAFQEFLHKYYPSYIKPNDVKLSRENFSFVFTTRRIDEYLDLFDKNLKGFNYANLNGRIDTRQNLLSVNGDIPQFSYRNISFYKVVLNGRGNFDSLSMEANMGEVYVNDSLHFPSTHIRFRSFNDISDIRIKTSANQTLNAADISARVETLTDGARITFKPSTFDINSKTWTIDRNGELLFTHNNIAADGVRIYSGDQELRLTTRPSAEGNWNDVFVDLKKINIGDFTPFFTKSERIEGLLTGSGTISDPFHNPYATFRGQADYFRFNNDSVGSVGLTASYSKRTGLVNASVHSDNNDYHFDVNGIFDLADSAATPINITVPNIVDTRIDALEKYLGGIFSNLTGYASGNLQVVGKSDNLNYLGDISVKNARLKVNYTQVEYKIPFLIAHLRADQLDLGNLEIYDTLDNKAQITRGRLYHHSFKDMRYDFALTTNRLLMLNTRITDNNQFYGTLIGRANMTLSGPQENLQMYLKGEPVDSSRIFLPMNSGRETADADFIVWKVYGKEMKKQKVGGLTDNFTVTMDIAANNYANVSVIIDPLTKDIIRANGHGNLRMQVGTNTNLNLRGRYEIDRGDYNFTFQSFIKKPFVFKEDVGNYIQWSGDPYDADINIQAVYEAQNVQFSDLGDALNQITVSNKLQSYHGPVWVNATLTDKLMKPTINFELELPPNSELRNNQDAAFLIQKIESDPNELNKQVAFLIVFNSFGPLSTGTTTFSGNEAVNGVVYNSISGALSSALSSWSSRIFQRVFNDKSIRVNFNTSFYNGSAAELGTDQAGYRGVDRNSVNLSVIKSFLNERLVFTVGSGLDYGLSPSQQAQSSTVQFLPNVTAEWKLTPSGKVVLTFFYRDSYNYLSLGNHTQNSSGTSISYRHDFDSLGELLRPKKKQPARPTP